MGRCAGGRTPEVGTVSDLNWVAVAAAAAVAGIGEGVELRERKMRTPGDEEKIGAFRVF